ncbi:MAG: 16S rRNA (uracil(1498)-N(3))-methyltransferase [Myxococcales bacterium]|nr:16S rRNA (uracil(1498)-N(3))-methyltransferase [Myxococcales bacterium]MBP6844290.1 16S rRNA (uracil(1498)-N(3))-methyltransferase [Kofleriaceae bacterium]
MNLLLVDEAELVDGCARLTDRRADHLRQVLDVAVGQRLRAGIAGGAIGAAEVLARDAAAVTVRLCDLAPPPPPTPITLVLAIPRPKVLARTLETAAAFAVSRIELINAWRVDKSYFGSPRLAADELAAHVRLGAEQGGTTHLPPVRVHPRLMAFLDEHHPPDAPPSRALCAHARGGLPIEAAPGPANAPTTLAIGPEGGWIEREVDTFAARGFTIVSLGDAILRTEAAVAGALAQLALLRRLHR